MRTSKTIVFLYLIISSVVHSAPMPNGNATNPAISVSGRASDESTCKTDDGRVEIPLNGRIRLGNNPCKVCTCLLTGFACEDQCEAASSSTTIVAARVLDSTTTTTPGLSPSSPTMPTSPLPIVKSSTTPTSTLRASTIESILNVSSAVTTATPHPRTTAHEPLLGREYAFLDCSEVYLSGKRTTGIYEIWPQTSPKPFRVRCDMDTDGGGWTVIQRRGDFTQQSNFSVAWSLYKRGFGDLNRDFWLGNEKMHALSSQDEYRLHVDMEDFNDQSRFADYDWFWVTDEQTKYILNLGRYVTSSTAVDSLSHNRGMRFTTHDQDNDHSVAGQCADLNKSGWWHQECTYVNLNGIYARGNESTATGVFWNSRLGAKYPLKSCEMKIRPIGFNGDLLL